MTTDAAPFEPGDLVHDRDEDPDERGTAVVVNLPDTRADAYEIASVGATVAAVNEAHPSNAQVVEVAFAGWLDSTVPEWRGMLDDAQATDRTFHDLLAAYATEWGVPRQVYAYPVTRLEPRRYCPDHLMRAEYVPEYRPAGEPSTWVCPLDECGNDAVAAPDEPLNARDERPRPTDSWGSEGDS